MTRRSCVANYHGLYITGAGGAGAKIRLGIYRDNGQLTPSTLLNDIGEVSAETEGWKEIYKVVTFEEPGYYWLVWVSNDGTIDIHYSVTYLAGVWGAPSRSAPFTYGALPDTFPTPISEWTAVTRRYMQLISYQ